mmetsp:Transcript_43133/g.100549  ORF Transcript_43133/g.100549 Transcript_43133/m.100549 type:complete len:368 (-) Transcript_43133:281-1384(-)
MVVPKYVALGHAGTFVICWSDSSLSWSKGLPQKLYKLLNGRYNNSGQSNSPVSCISYSGDIYGLCYQNGSWQSLGVEGLSGSLNKLNDGETVSCLSLGPSGSYIVIGSAFCTWKGIPERAAQLIKTRSTASLQWAALGFNEAYFLLFSDGKYYWANVHPALDALLRTSWQDIERLFLSAADGSYFLLRKDGKPHWNVCEEFDKEMGVEPQQAPGKKRKTVSYSYLRPSEIRFSHKEIGPVFSSGKYSIKDTFLSLHKRERQPEDLPLMYVVHHRGHYVSISNRRLAVYRLLEIYGKSNLQIPVEIVQRMGSFPSRYSTECDGRYAFLHHTQYWIGRTREETNFDPFNHKLKKPPVTSCCDSDGDSDI